MNTHLIYSCRKIHKFLASYGTIVTHRFVVSARQQPAINHFCNNWTATLIPPGTNAHADRFRTIKLQIKTFKCRAA